MLAIGILVGESLIIRMNSSCLWAGLTGQSVPRPNFTARADSCVSVRGGSVARFGFTGYVAYGQRVGAWDSGMKNPLTLNLGVVGSIPAGLTE
jgi:hypothetical protein